MQPTVIPGAALFPANIMQVIKKAVDMISTAFL
jgi:hypothetical protein